MTGIIDVRLKCPACSFEWLAAQIDMDSWWGKDTKPETIARACYCPHCHAQPPMQITRTEIQPSLFGGVPV
jgi:hypothetical protein